MRVIIHPPAVPRASGCTRAAAPSSVRRRLASTSASALSSAPRQRRAPQDRMPISQKIRDLIRSAWDDGAPCLVATNGPDGPNISVKGSTVVFDDHHLAYWER